MRVRIVEDEILIDLTGKEQSILNQELRPNIVRKNFALNKFSLIPKKSIAFAGKLINPHYYTCSCKDYRSYAEKYPKRDLRRICKHLFIYLSKNHFEDIDLVSRILLEHKFWYKIINVFELEINNVKILIGYTKDFEIFHIYIPPKLPVFYSYNSSLKKWKNADEPPLDSEINFALKKFLNRLNLVSQKMR